MKKQPCTVTDESGDAQYYTIVPRYVWAVARSPYDIALWMAIKDVAGNAGECYLTTGDLATLAMMSAGKVSDCRRHLIKTGCLVGELRQDAGYPLPVWHIRVPDLWEKNVVISKQLKSLEARIALKGGKKEIGHDRGASCGEIPLTPGETNKYSIKNPLSITIENSTNQQQPAREEGIAEMKAIEIDTIGFCAAVRDGADEILSRIDGISPEQKAQAVVDLDIMVLNLLKAQAEDTRTAAERIVDAVRSGAAQDNTVQANWVKLFGTTPNFTNKTGRAFVAWLRDMPASQTLEQFAAWWYESDWRGKNGNPPTLANVQEYWNMAYAAPVTTTGKQKARPGVMPEGI